MLRPSFPVSEGKFRCHYYYVSLGHTLLLRGRGTPDSGHIDLCGPAGYTEPYSPWGLVDLSDIIHEKPSLSDVNFHSTVWILLIVESLSRHRPGHASLLGVHGPRVGSGVFLDPDLQEGGQDRRVSLLDPRHVGEAVVGLEGGGEALGVDVGEV